MKIGVFCSSHSDLPKAWTEAADTLGRTIGSAGSTLVYGGVNAGLMAVIAHAVKESSGRVAGVVPVIRREVTSPLNDVTIPCADLASRKQIMNSVSDMFVCLPGGYGTLDELFSAYAQIRFTGRHKPIVVYSPDGVYDHLRLLMDNITALGLMDRDPDMADILTTVTTADELSRTVAHLIDQHHKQ